MSDEATGDAAFADGGIPPIDFTTFVLSMSTACMANLGHRSDGEEPGPPNLPMARQTIEILEMIEGKTSGNLTGEEERILTQVLADLRDAYEQAS